MVFAVQGLIAAECEPPASEIREFLIFDYGFVLEVAEVKDAGLAAVHADFKRSGTDLQVLDVIADISNEIERLLVNEAVIEYRKKHIHDESVVQAMEKSGVLADVVDMSALLASLAVGGKQEVEDNCKPLLEENNLTVADVIKVADAYQVE